MAFDCNSTSRPPSIEGSGKLTLCGGNNLSGCMCASSIIASNHHERNRQCGVLIIISCFIESQHGILPFAALPAPEYQNTGRKERQRNRILNYTHGRNKWTWNTNLLLSAEQFSLAIYTKRLVLLGH